MPIPFKPEPEEVPEGPAPDAHDETVREQRALAYEAEMAPLLQAMMDRHDYEAYEWHRSDALEQARMIRAGEERTVFEPGGPPTAQEFTNAMPPYARRRMEGILKQLQEKFEATPGIRSMPGMGDIMAALQDDLARYAKAEVVADDEESDRKGEVR